MPRVSPGVGVVRDQLEAPEVHLHGDEGHHGDDQGGQRDQDGQPVGQLLGEPLVQAQEGQGGSAHRGQDDQEGQERDAVAHDHHVRLRRKTIRAAMPRAMPRA